LGGEGIVAEHVELLVTGEQPHCPEHHVGLYVVHEFSDAVDEGFLLRRERGRTKSDWR